MVLFSYFEWKLQVHENMVVSITIATGMYFSLSLYPPIEDRAASSVLAYSTVYVVSSRWRDSGRHTSASQWSSRSGMPPGSCALRSASTEPSCLSSNSSTPERYTTGTGYKSWAWPTAPSSWKAAYLRWHTCWMPASFSKH